MLSFFRKTPTDYDDATKRYFFTADGEPKDCYWNDRRNNCLIYPVYVQPKSQRVVPDGYLPIVFKTTIFEGFLNTLKVQKADLIPSDQHDLVTRLNEYNGPREFIKARHY